MFDFLKGVAPPGNAAARAELLWKQGARLLARKQYQRAIVSMREASELEPGRIEGRLNLAAALNLTGSWEEAVTHLKYVLAFDPENTMALLNLAAAYDGLGRLEESVATLEQLVGRRPQWKDAHYNLAVAYYKQQSYQQAITALRDELTLNPGHTLARELLDKIYLMPSTHRVKHKG